MLHPGVTPAGRRGKLNATAVTIVDWNGNGLLDMLTGAIDGSIYLIENVGSKTDPKWSPAKALTTASNKPVGAAADRMHHTNAAVADWDGDGLPDLIVAGGNKIVFHRNVGTRTEPRLADGVELTPPAGKISNGDRFKVDVADFNGDGRLDLIVGDFGYERSNPASRSITYFGHVYVCLRSAAAVPSRDAPTDTPQR